MDNKEINLRLVNIKESAPVISDFNEADLKNIKAQFTLMFNGVIEDNMFHSIGVIKFTSKDRIIVNYEFALEIDVQQLSDYAVKQGDEIRFTFPEEFMSLVVTETYCMGRGLLYRYLPDELKPVHIKLGGYRELLNLIKEHPNGMNN